MKSDFEHLIYHPKWGYKTVGSTCVEYLTAEDRFVSREAVKTLKGISEFVDKSEWFARKTKKGGNFIESYLGHNQIRIYGNDLNYAYQIVMKVVGERRHDFQSIVPLKNKTLPQVKELGFIALKGILSESESQKRFCVAFIAA